MRISQIRKSLAQVKEELIVFNSFFNMLPEEEKTSMKVRNQKDTLMARIKGLEYILSVKLAYRRVKIMLSLIGLGMVGLITYLII